jgi:hypothetical protein
MKSTLQEAEWSGCYDDNWNGFIVPTAFAHPAKFARGLVTRIYRHMLEQGWIKPGDVCFDPFGGIGTGGIVAASLGLQWVGCELEERFYNLALENFALHRRTWEAMGDPLPVILHGDSRNAAALVRAHGVVSSPPFLDARNGTTASTSSNGGPCTDRIASVANGDLLGDTPGQLGGMPTGDLDAAISSPPYAETATNGSRENRAANLDKAGIDSKAWLGNARCTQGRSEGYGAAPGQLGAMKEGAIDSVLSSPPYSESLRKGEPTDPVKSHANQARDIMAGKGIASHYGETPGQLGNLKEGDVDAAVSSPPFEDSEAIAPRANGLMEKVAKKHGNNKARQESCDMQDYGRSAGQLGNDTGETFWAAARQIVEQTYLLLKPGGIAAWVCKDYVKAGKRVPFCDNWARLCEACGFEVIQRVRAMLVKEETHAGLFGAVTKKTERKSFFRRLHERKPGAVRIDWEEVLFMRKRESHGEPSM